MDKLSGYIDSLKNYGPQADFEAMYSGVLSRHSEEAGRMPKALRLSAAFAVLLIAVLGGLYLGTGPSGTAPISYIFEQEAYADNGAVSYIFSE